MSRKYRQRGYREDESERPRRRAGTRPQRPEGPRGRGLGAPTATHFACARCGARQADGHEVAPDATCGKCGSDLHTCTNCRHFDTSAPLECRKPIEERIAAKAKRNACELFAPKQVQGFAADAETPSDGKAAFDALFDF